MTLIIGSIIAVMAGMLIGCPPSPPADITPSGSISASLGALIIDEGNSTTLTFMLNEWQEDVIVNVSVSESSLTLDGETSKRLTLNGGSNSAVIIVRSTNDGLATGNRVYPIEITVTGNVVTVIPSALMVTVIDLGSDRDLDGIPDDIHRCVMVPDPDDASRTICDTDIDDDDDGLIEIYTLEQLHAMRYNMAGTGYTPYINGPTTTVGAPILPTANCTTSSVDGTYLCGYELMNDLDFDTDGDGKTFDLMMDGTTAIAVPDDGDRYYLNGMGWRPIGRCTSDDGECTEPFTAIFEGNMHTIRNLFVRYGGSKRYGTGLFGAATHKIQNITMDNLYVENISKDDDNIGGLVGYARGAVIANVFVTGVVRGSESVLAFDVGGIAGDNADGTIHSSLFRGNVSGRGNVGGLAGVGRIIINSHASGSVAGALSGKFGGPIGGLMGIGSNAMIVNSYVNMRSLQGIDFVGGLVGVIFQGMIANSYAVAERITSPGTVGAIEARMRNENNPVIQNTYYDSTVGNIEGYGGARTTTMLQAPIDFSDIYAAWDDGIDTARDDDSDIDLDTRWCDTNRNGMIEAAEQTDNNRVWDLGTASQYPVIRCTPDGTASQRR